MLNVIFRVGWQEWHKTSIGRHNRNNIGKVGAAIGKNHLHAMMCIRCRLQPRTSRGGWGGIRLELHLNILSVQPSWWMDRISKRFSLYSLLMCEVKSLFTLAVAAFRSAPTRVHSRAETPVRIFSQVCSRQSPVGKRPSTSCTYW